MNPTIFLRPMTAADWPEAAEIYREGLETGNATFQNSVPNWEEWDAAHLKTGRIVAEMGGAVAGWAALTPVSGRCVYEGVAEVSVYVGQKFRGAKIGSQLLEKLVLQSEADGLWTLQAGVFPENLASLKIHETAGFRQVGFREKIGKMGGVWRDTVLLERRSKQIGTN